MRLRQLMETLDAVYIRDLLSRMGYQRLESRYQSDPSRYYRKRGSPILNITRKDRSGPWEIYVCSSRRDPQIGDYPEIFVRKMPGRIKVTEVKRFIEETIEMFRARMRDIETVKQWLAELMGSLGEVKSSNDIEGGHGTYTWVVRSDTAIASVRLYVNLGRIRIKMNVKLGRRTAFNRFVEPKTLESAKQAIDSNVRMFKQSFQRPDMAMKFMNTLSPATLRKQFNPYRNGKDTIHYDNGADEDVD